jgi:hypothetical protein
MRMGIGIGWPNASAGSTPPPTVYEYQGNNCGGFQGVIYSASPVFQAGITIYNDPELTEPVDSNAFGDPFNVDPNELIPGFVCDNDGLVSNSDTLCP